MSAGRRSPGTEVLANPIENDPEFWKLGVDLTELHTGTRDFVACNRRVGVDARMIAGLPRASGLLGTKERMPA